MIVFYGKKSIFLKLFNELVNFENNDATENKKLILNSFLDPKNFAILNPFK